MTVQNVETAVCVYFADSRITPILLWPEYPIFSMLYSPNQRAPSRAIPRRNVSINVLAAVLSVPMSEFAPAKSV